MADNNGDQLNTDMSKLTEQVNKLIIALGTVTKDSTDSLVQMKKQIQLCTTELLNMESIAGGSNTALNGLRNQVGEATKRFNEIMVGENQNGKILADIADDANDTGEKIGELLKNEKMGLEFTKDINDNISTVVIQNKTATQLAAEAAREAKKGGSADASKLGRDTTRSSRNSEESERKSDSDSKGIIGGLTQIVTSLRTSLYTVAGILAGFVTGAVKLYGNLFMTIFDGLKAFTVRVSSIGQSISGFAKKFATGMFGVEGGLFTPLIDMMKSGMKFIDRFMGFSDFYQIVIKGLISKLVNFTKEAGDFFAFAGKSIAKPFISFGKTLGEIFGPIGNKFIQFFKGLDDFVQFATKPLAGLGTKISNMFSGVGRLFGGGAAAIEGAEVGVGFFAKTLSRIGEFFSGGKLLATFEKAFAFGETIASKIPFLAIIPTAIDTIVSAFKKFDTEGMKGVFKSIIVGLLKGLAAFFTLGLSDLVIDFEKLYTAISKPLDGFFDQVMGIVKIFGDIFNWMIGTLTQLWNGFLKPIIMSLYEDALKPIIDTLGALADVAFKVVAIIFKLLTPVFAIIKFIFKVLFEVVKLIWDYVVWPILSILVPVFKVVFSVIGFLFNTMKIGFEAMSEGFQYILDAIDPAIADITKFFDDATGAFDYLGQVVDDFMKPLVDMFGSLGQMLSDVWSNIVEKFKPLLSFLGIEIGSTSSKTGMSASPSTAMSASAVISSPKEMKSAAGNVAGGSPVITQVTHAPTTNNVVNGGGGGSTVILSPNPVRHSDSTRHMIGH